MNASTTLSLSEARKQLFIIANQVQKPGVYYTLTENGRAKAALISAEELESLLETVDILHAPDLLKEIRGAKKAYQRGDFLPLEMIDKKYVPRSRQNIRTKKSKKT